MQKDDDADIVGPDWGREPMPAYEKGRTARKVHCELRVEKDVLRRVLIDAGFDLATHGTVKVEGGDVIFAWQEEAG